MEPCQQKSPAPSTQASAGVRCVGVGAWVGMGCRIYAGICGSLFELFFSVYLRFVVAIIFVSP